MTGRPTYSRTPLMMDRMTTILKYAAEGYTARDCARFMNISYDTAAAYRREILAWLEAVNMTQAVANAIRLGIIE